MQPVEEVIPLRFITAITSGYICSDNERTLFALTVKFGGLGLFDYCKAQNIEYRNSKKLTKDPTEAIILQNKKFQINTEEIKK